MAFDFFSFLHNSPLFHVATRGRCSSLQHFSWTRKAAECPSIPSVHLIHSRVNVLSKHLEVTASTETSHCKNSSTLCIKKKEIPPQIRSPLTFIQVRVFLNKQLRVLVFVGQKSLQGFLLTTSMRRGEMVSGWMSWICRICLLYSSVIDRSSVRQAMIFG